MGRQRRVSRPKTMELVEIAPESYSFNARLSDLSANCDYGSDATEDQIHDFVVDGAAAGHDLTLTALEVSAAAHPYRVCLPSSPSAGRSLASPSPPDGGALSSTASAAPTDAHT